jgi:hypothetical protein
MLEAFFVRRNIRIPQRTAERGWRSSSLTSPRRKAGFTQQDTSICAVIPGRRTSGEPGTHIPEAGVHGFRAASLPSAPGMTALVKASGAKRDNYE